MATAQILAAVFIGLNNFFSGLIVRPQYLSGFFEIPYWITPGKPLHGKVLRNDCSTLHLWLTNLRLLNVGHYVYEGMVVASFSDDQREVLAEPGTTFYSSLCGDDWPDNEPCIGTIEQFIDNFFGGKFQRAHLWYDILALAVYLVSARILTFFALKYCNYTGM
jgi:hypothetical protein